VSVDGLICDPCLREAPPLAAAACGQCEHNPSNQGAAGLRYALQVEIGMTARPTLSTVQECLRRINSTAPAQSRYRGQLVRDALDNISKIAALAEAVRMEDE